MDSRESNETLCQFRRESLKKLLVQLESCACGYDRPVMPFITNRQEQYSAKKTMQLINRLTDFPESGYANSCPAPRRSFYKSMLYCAIRCFSTPCTIHSGSVTLGVYSPAFTFGDLIKYMHSEEQDASESYERSISFGILKRPVNGFLAANMTALYVYLSGQEEPKPNLLDGEFIPLHTSEAEDEAFCPDEEEMEDTYYEERLEEPLCQLEQPFPFPEEYCQHYENILRLFPEYYCKELFDRHMEDMINHFLTEQNLTIFSDGDTHIMTISYLKKALKMIQNLQH